MSAEALLVPLLAFRGCVSPAQVSEGVSPRHGIPGSIDLDHYPLAAFHAESVLGPQLLGHPARTTRTMQPVSSTGQDLLPH